MATETFTLHPGEDDRVVTLYLTVGSDSHFRGALVRLPQVAEVLKGGNSKFVIERNPLFTKDDLTAALAPLVVDLIVRLTVPEPYTQTFALNYEGDAFRLHYQGEADAELLAALEADEAIRSITHSVRDRQVYIVWRQGYKKTEVTARIEHYATQHMARTRQH